MSMKFTEAKVLVQKIGNNLNISDVVALFKQCKPECIHDVKAMGLKVKLISDGLYRNCFKFKNLPLVIKLPHERSQYDVSIEDSIEHAANEIDVFAKLKKSKKLKAFKHLVPEIFYTDKEHGIILMREYRPLDKNIKDEPLLDALVNMTEAALRLAGVSTCDVHCGNLGLSEDSRYSSNYVVLLDVGLFGKGYDCEGES